MKKWTLSMGLIGAILLAIIMGAGASQVRGNAVFKETETGEEYSCQAVTVGKREYLFVWSNDIKKCATIKPGEGQEKYELLDAVSMEKIYYQYRYLNESGQWMYGVDSYDPKEKAVKKVLLWGAGSTEWLAFDGNRESGKLAYSVWNKEEKQIEEYMLNLSEEKPEWKGIRTIDVQSSVWSGFYDESHGLNICLSDGRAYCYVFGSATVEEVQADIFFGKNLSVADEAKNHFTILCIATAFNTIFLGYLALFVICGILVIGIGKGKSLVIRMYSIAELVLLFTVLVCTGLYEYRIYIQMSETQLLSAEKQLQKISGQKQADGTISREQMDGEVSSGIFTDILEIDRNTMRVKNSVKVPVGIEIASGYGKELLDAAQQAASERKSIHTGFSYRGNPVWGIILYDWSDVEETTMLAGIIDGNAAAEFFLKGCRIDILAALLIFLSGSVIINCSFIVYQGRWQNFLQTVHAAASEKADKPTEEKANKIDYSVFGKKVDGMNAMWNSFQEMSSSMERLEYEKQQSIFTYSRFAPKGLEKLFDKEDLSEIQTDSLRIVSGAMVQFSMDSLKNQEGRQYMQMVDRNMEVMHGVLKEQSGMLICCNPDFLESKCFFRENADDAVAFAIEMSDNYRKEPLLAQKQKMFLIHNSEYYCGIAGTREQAVTFAYSREDELLGTYEDALKRAGLRVVVTENVMSGLKDSCYTVRYIGYVSDRELGRSLKLYECLDAYSEAKRKLLVKALPLFEKALNLFYSDDFYLARSTFNKVLQINPTDKIARWYLFNCEYYLNRAGSVEVSYGLYENQMLEQQYQS